MSVRAVSAGSGIVTESRRSLKVCVAVRSSGRFQRPIRKGVAIWTLLFWVLKRSESVTGTPLTGGRDSTPPNWFRTWSLVRENDGDQVTACERLIGAGETLRLGKD